MFIFGNLILINKVSVLHYPSEIFIFLFMKKKFLFIFLIFHYFSWSQSADLIVVKTDGSDTYTAGQTITYTITITNDGPDAAVNVVVEDLVPVGINSTSVNWTGSNGSAGSGDLLDTIPLIQVGEVFTYEVVIPVPSNFDQTTNLVNTVLVTSDTSDPNPDCPGCTDINTPNPLANLVTVKTNNRTQWVRNESTTYTITITNNGPSDAFNVVVSDPLPAGITQMAWTGPNGTSGNGPLLETLTVIENGQSVVFLVTIFVPNTYNLTSNLANTVIISSDTTDPLPACPQCTDTDTPAPRFVTVDTNTFSVPELIQNVLINSGCAVVNNFTSSNTAGCTPIGYFKGNNSTFPFKEGVVIRTGNANFTQGHYTGNNLGDNCPAGSTDAGLTALAVSQGQNNGILNAAFIQFNFTPLTDNFSFNFLFASNEYGTFQCTFGDVFAFFLTNLDTGITTNLAVVPGTTTPVSVTTIRDTAHNGGCASVNPEFFDVFNQTLVPNTDTAINMRGQTVVLNASSTVIPNANYTIRLVIGDYQDTAFDSAVFIEGGSFDVGTAGISGTSGFENFGEFTIENGGALCPGGCKTIRAGSSPISIATYEWTFNGSVIPGATDYTLEVCDEGVYGVTVTIGGAISCQQIDQTIVESFLLPDINVDNIDMSSCGTFNLNDNTPIILDGLFGEISYHNTQQDAANAANPIPNANTYPGFDGEVIYAAVQIDGEDCISAISFNLIVPGCTLNPQPTDIPPLCDSDGDGFEVFDLTLAETNALNGLPASENTITYHNSFADADAGVNPIVGSTTYSGFDGEQIYIRVQDNTDPIIYGTTVITLTVIDPPVLSDFSDVELCDAYILPALTIGNYFDAPDGTGTAYAAGDSITTTTLMYVYAETGTTPNCTDERTFTITINQTPTPDQPDDVESCDSYVLPALTIGNYFDGPGATGTAYNAGDTILTTTTLYVYAETATTPNCFAENTFTITINETPTPDQPDDVELCDAYILPALTIGNYFDAPDGTGTAYAAGDSITTTTLMYVYAETGTTPNCTDERTFTITINQTPTPDQPDDVESCDSYVLPALTIGNYFDGPGATGTAYNAGDTILTTTTLYVYAETATTPNCFAENTFTITINETPTPDQPDDVEACDEYILPALTTGNYFDAPDGTGTAYAAGDSITTTTLMYVYAETGTTPNCTDERTFTITINQTPTPDQPDDVEVCDSYVLPALTIGNYFQGPGATGTPYNTGDTIFTTTTLYVYAQTATTPNCFAENTFTVTINDTPTPDQPDDVEACDAYILPALTIGNYFDGPDGTGTAYSVGDAITTTTLMYVYAETGTTPNCAAENTFTITINETPTPDQPDDVTACQEYELPELTIGDYYSGPGATGIAYNQGDLITTTTTLYVYAETGTTPNCFAENTFTVTIVAPPTIGDPDPIRVCDDNNDGFANFDLTLALPEITLNQPNLTVTFHQTQTDAELGVNAIVNPAAFNNNNQATQIIYVRVIQTGAPDCSAQTTLTLIVDPRPVLNTPIATYALCDQDNGGDGIEVFDLTSWYNEITPQAGLTLSFAYEEAGVLIPIATPTAFANTQLWGQTITVTAENAFGCQWSGTFEIEVLPLPTVIPPADLAACSDGITPGVADFDLTVRNLQITAGVPGVLVSYHLTQNQADNNQGALTMPYSGADGQVLFVRVENAATGCYDTTTLTLIVNEGPVANTPTPLTYCDPNNDNVGIFDLTQVELQVTGGAVNSQVSYHTTLTDAELGTNPITTATNYSSLASVTAEQIIYIRVQSSVTDCVNIAELLLIVNPTPVIADPEDVVALEVCDDDTDGIASFDLSLSIENILNGLDPALHTVTFHGTEASAQAGTPQITNILNYANTTPNTETIWVRVAITATGCFKVVPLTLIVNELPPVAFPILTYELCETGMQDEREVFDIRVYAQAQVNNSAWSLRFYFSQADAQADQNPLPDQYQNQSNPQTIWVVVTNDQTGCQSTTVMDLLVNPRPQLLLPLNGLTQCDTNGQGFGSFDLLAEIPTLLNNATGITVSFHSTQTDAELGVNPLANPYSNTLAYQEFVYIRAVDDITDCVNTFMLALNVNPSPLMPELPNLTLCDQDNNPQSGTTTFNLTQQNAAILAAQPQGLGNYTIRYFTSEENAQNNTSAIVTPQSYNNTTNPQTIWVRVQNTTTNCFTLGSFTLIVNLPENLPVSMGTYPLCDANNDGFMIFDLPGRVEQAITGGQTGFTITYYPSLANAQGGTNAIANPNQYQNAVPAAQTIGIEVINGQGCRTITTLTLLVLPTPVVVSNPPLLEACDDNNAGDLEEEFDLTTHQNLIAGGDPNLTFAYYPTQEDAVNDTNQITSPTNYSSPTGSVWIKVMNQQQTAPGEFCYTLVEQLLEVHPLPQINSTIEDFVQCTVGSVPAVFDLGSWIDEITDEEGLTMSFHLTQAQAIDGTNALANNYTNTSNPQEIWVRLVNPQTGCVSTGSFNLVIEEGAEANPVSPTESGLTVCDQDGTNDGQTTFDLTPYGAIVLGAQDPSQYTVTYYESLADAQALQNAIVNPASYVNTTPFSQDIYIRVTNISTTTQCFEFMMITLTVHPLPELTLEDGFICIDLSTGVAVAPYTIVSNIANPQNYIFEWTFNGNVLPGVTSSSLTTTQAGIYGVTATNIATGCSMLQPELMLLQETSAAQNVQVIVDGAFSQNQTVTIIVQGIGDYEYQFNNGPFQDSNVFTGVPPGQFTITVRDKNNGGCDVVVETGTAINYPNFFTPNADGYNDTWNIIGMEDPVYNAKIYIFDRYGKLLKQISPRGLGWDGTYNGQSMPSTDYWFTVTYEENGTPKEFKAHFSLKR
jgi:large repetitive protein